MTMTTDFNFYGMAIRTVHQEAVTIRGEEAFDQEDNPVVLDNATITAEVTRLQAEYDANAYARSRKTKYDQLNQFELMTDDARDGTTTHAEAIEAIKAEFPKPV